MKLRVSHILKALLLSAIPLVLGAQIATAQSVSYAGGTTTWGTDQAAFGTADTYTNAMDVTLNGDSTLTLTTDVAPNSLTLSDDANVEITGESKTLSSSNITLAAGSTLDLNVMLASGALVSGEGSLILNKSVNNDQTNYTSTLAGFTGNLTIANDSNVRLESDTSSMKSITVTESGFLRLHGNVDIGAATTVHLDGTVAESTISFSTNTSIASQLQASGNAKLSATYDTATLSSGVAGTGTLIVEAGGGANGIMRILGESTHTGNMHLTRGTTTLGSGASVDFSEIIIDSDATLNLATGASQGSSIFASGSSITGQGTLLLNTSVGQFLFDSVISSFEGDIVVNSGGLRFDRSYNTFNSVTINAGTSLRIDYNVQGVGADVTVNFVGSDTLGGSRATYSTSDGTNFQGIMNATGEVTLLSGWNDQVISGELRGSGNLYVQSSDGSLVNGVILEGNSTHSGNLIIESGYFQLGNGSGNQVTADFETVTINSGSKFTVSTASNAGLDETTFILNGGTFHSYDTSPISSGSLQIKKFQVNANSTFSNEWKGKYEVAELSGNADLTFSGTSAEQLIFSVGTIEGYNGTINLGEHANRDLEINNIRMNDGDGLTIKGDSDGIDATAGVSVQGDGNLRLESALHVTGDLSIDKGTVTSNQAITASDSITGTNGATLVLEGAASISVGGAAASYHLSGDGISITQRDAGEFSLTSTSISNAIISGATINVTDVLTLSNVTLDASTTWTGSAQGKVVVESSVLTSLTVADSGSIDFNTGEGTEAKDIQSYTITGLSTLLAGSAATGSLTLNLGDLVNFVDPSISDDMFAFILGDEAITSLSDVIASNNYSDISLIVNGQSYKVLGSAMYSGDVLLYIPEPSTATLSLLALTGLLARRRRKAA